MPMCERNAHGGRCKRVQTVLEEARRAPCGARRCPVRGQSRAPRRLRRDPVFARAVTAHRRLPLLGPTHGHAPSWMRQPIRIAHERQDHMHRLFQHPVRAPRALKCSYGGAPIRRVCDYGHHDGSRHPHSSPVHQGGLDFVNARHHRSSRRPISPSRDSSGACA